MKLQLVTVPYDSGHPDRRLGEGPGHLTPHLMDVLTADRHQTESSEVRLADAFHAEVQAAIELQGLVHHAVTAARAAGRLPIVLAGNCNGAAFGCVSALGEHDGGERDGNKREGIVWFDAHGDYNTPASSASGYFDGMSLAVLTGRAWPQVRERMVALRPVPETAVLFVGGRDLDAAEADLLEASAIVRLQEDEISDSLEGCLDELARRVDRAYVHVDLDVLDPSVLTANPWGRPGGLSLEALVAAIRSTAERIPIGALALTAYGPAFDVDNRGPAVAAAIVRAALVEGE